MNFIPSVRLIATLAALSLLALAAGCGATPEPEVVEVEKVVEVEVVREVEVPVDVEKVVEVEKIVRVEVPVEVEKIVFKEVPVEVEKVVIKEVPVEVVKEVEVVVEKVVTPTPVPTPVTADTGVLFIDNHDWAKYTNLPAIGFSEGIPVTVTDDQDAAIPFLNIAEYRAVLVTNTPNAQLLRALYDYVHSGGNAAVFMELCDSEALQAEFKVACANTPHTFFLQGRGEWYAPFWNGLTIASSDLDPRYGHRARVHFLAGQTDFTCVRRTHPEIGSFCTAVYGKVGRGKAIFLTNSANYGCTNPYSSPYSSCPSHFLEDRSIHLKDNTEAAARLFHWLVEGPSSRALPAYDSFDAASVLARFSTSDPIQGEARADAASQIIARHKSGDVDTAHILDLLHTIAPELSIAERRQATDELARLSEDGDWSDADTLDAVQHLAAVVTGNEINAQKRIVAANRMVELYQSGDLDADTALNLMDTIAPGLAINQRRQAAESLARLAADDDWDDADRMAAASEVFRLVTGVPLDAERRMAASVDLAGVGVKIFDTNDQFDDRDIDNATTIIKQAISGNLTTESLQNILGFGN